MKILNPVAQILHQTNTNILNPEIWTHPTNFCVFIKIDYYDSSHQVIWIVDSGVSHLPLDNVPQIFYGIWVCWPINHSVTVVIKQGIGSFGTEGQSQCLLEDEISLT